MDILIDFDGTCVTHEFPKIGKDIGAQHVLKRLVSYGHRLILFTMRSNVTAPVSENPLIHNEPGNYLDDAVKWFHAYGIPLYGIQTNPTQHTWTTSPKAYGQLMIDDSALGCPLAYDRSYSERPYVDWKQVERILEERRIFR